MVRTLRCFERIDHAVAKQLCAAAFEIHLDRFETLLTCLFQLYSFAHFRLQKVLTFKGHFHCSEVYALQELVQRGAPNYPVTFVSPTLIKTKVGRPLLFISLAPTG